MNKTSLHYFIGRAADILSTWLNVQVGGYGVEASPVGRWSMETLGFGGYVALNLLASFLVYLGLKRLARPWLMTLVIAAFYGISLFNVVVYVTVRHLTG